jgi:hypothetical protein
VTTPASVTPTAFTHVPDGGAQLPAAAQPDLAFAPAPAPPAPAAAVEEPRKLDPEEVAGSVTGFDEIAVERAFGRELTDLGESTKSLRALAFVLARRRGLDDTAAYNEVMGQTLNQVMDLFALGDDEPQTLADVQAAIEGKA